MNEDIIRMAREADEYADKHTPLYVTVPNEWQEIRDKRFARLVMAAERDRCSEVAYEFLDDPLLSGHGYATGCRDAILAREEND